MRLLRFGQCLDGAGSIVPGFSRWLQLCLDLLWLDWPRCLWLWRHALLCGRLHINESSRVTSRRSDGAPRQVVQLLDPSGLGALVTEVEHVFRASAVVRILFHVDADGVLVPGALVRHVGHLERVAAEGEAGVAGAVVHVERTAVDCDADFLPLIAVAELALGSRAIRGGRGVAGGFVPRAPCG